MTVTAAASVEVATSARTVLEFVLDLERYKHADPKIVRVSSVDEPDEQGRGSVRIWATMWRLPPAPDRHDISLERWSRVTFTGARRQLGRLMFDFTGVVECTPTTTGTLVTHSYEIRFKGPFRLLEPRLERWLTAQIDEEVRDLAALVS